MKSLDMLNIEICAWLGMLQFYSHIACLCTASLFHTAMQVKTNYGLGFICVTIFSL